ncbi:MAG TPA: DUF6541 family protein [Candidatus Nanoarchaeia archaeon]|nr:DUF6541 family protein [Candidatus Nanoarchaeia archaeon]
MKLNKNYLQTFIFVLVYLFAIYFWSQPLREIKIPYGEYDAMSHFEVADYIAYNDRSFLKLPDYIDTRYGNDNDFKPHTLWYPPTFHSSLAVMEVVGGGRAVPVYLMNTILATFVMITVYFAINSLFGFLPAILSSILLIFSPRDFLPYLWGQWPERFGYAFIPLVMYCFYMYFISYKKENSKPRYIYLAALFLAIQLLVHPLSFFHSVLGIAVLYVFLAVKQKKLALNWKHIAVSALIFLILFMAFPYQTFNIFSQFGRGAPSEKSSQFNFSRIFQWSLNPADYAGSVPESYFSFRDMHGLWTLPFLLIGIFILVWRREERDLFLLAWLIALYFVLHRDLIGKANFLHRSLSASAHIFAPLTAVGAVYLASLVKLPNNLNTYLKYAIAAVFVYFVVTVNLGAAATILNKGTYNPNPIDGKLTYDFLKTLTQQQFDAAQWILDNVPVGYNISVLGIPHEPNFLPATAYKMRWSMAVSQHVSRFYYLIDNRDTFTKVNYVMLDYTMVGPTGDEKLFNDMQSFEKNLTWHEIAYDKNNIRIYKPNGI